MKRGTCLKTENKIRFRYKIIQLRKMALRDIKIKVKTEKKGDKIRCFIAESIASIADIHKYVHRRFEGVEVEDVCYWG